ncbi:MAG TPA: sigma-54 dependent transcriptional regulator [Bdellovibrionota bacterium]|jgi:DNA-binding NtrC family response regulator
MGDQAERNVVTTIYGDSHLLRSSLSDSAAEAESEMDEKQKSVERESRRKNFQVISQDSVQRRVAVIDDDEGIRLYLGEVLGQQGFQVQEYPSAEAFLSKLESSMRSNSPFADVILCDVRLPGLDGLSFVSTMKGKTTEIPVILMTAYAEVQSAVRAMREGAYDYLEKPFDLARLNSVLENAIRYRQLAFENKFLKNMIDPDIKLAGVQCLSPSMKAIYDLIKRVAPTESSVLITGESGVGKEVVARAIHDNSNRADRPFISINCSAIPESLLESELFGHTKGSFTGATQHRKGLFEEADGGTLFLDEIGDLHFSLQAKLLRVFQEQKIRAVGDNKFRSVNVRIITATHKNLAEEIKVSRFREDLYYRLNVIPIHIPPLRQRKEDVVILAKYFLERSARKNKVDVKGFTPAALTKLVYLPWKGNVRELQNVIERSVILCQGDLIDETDIPVGQASDADDLIEEMAYDMPTLRDVERRYILSVLKKHNGKKDAAAKVLGMSRRTLYRKLVNQDDDSETLQ